MVWEDTGLKWVPTSPNIPTIQAARGYTATGFLGEIGIESGCGGPHPFEVIGGPDWNASAVTARFNALHIPAFAPRRGARAAMTACFSRSIRAMRAT